jgi:hypothetical protein
MKIFFYMGRNPANKSGVSWKIWKIVRTGRTVTMLWGHAKLRNRKVTPAGTLQSKTRRFPSTDAARDYEVGRIRSKLSKGYERRTRSRPN